MKPSGTPKDGGERPPPLKRPREARKAPASLR